MKWTTRLSELIPEMLTEAGVAEIHSAYFAPVNYTGGKGNVVSLGIPECELIVGLLLSDGGPLAIVNRPKINFKIDGWIKLACKEAVTLHAVVCLNCDTLKQLEQAVALAQNLLPQYERVALERMKDPKTRAKKGLS
jgi:hypothetical protein